jgi:hypothetical protein
MWAQEAKAMDGEREERIVRAASRAEVEEAGREVARRAHTLAWQAFLVSRNVSDWPEKKTNRAAMLQAWQRLTLAVEMMMDAMGAEEGYAKEARDERGQGE